MFIELNSTSVDRILINTDDIRYAQARGRWTRIKYMDGDCQDISCPYEEVKALITQSNEPRQQAGRAMGV